MKAVDAVLHEHMCFKSRKERLGLIVYFLSYGRPSAFQIPEGTFGTIARRKPRDNVI